MKKYLLITKSIDDAVYKTFEHARTSADDDEIIVEVEIKEIKRFKKGSWQEYKVNSPSPSPSGISYDGTGQGTNANE